MTLFNQVTVFFRCSQTLMMNCTSGWRFSARFGFDKHASLFYQLGKTPTFDCAQDSHMHCTVEFQKHCVFAVVRNTMAVYFRCRTCLESELRSHGSQLSRRKYMKDNDTFPKYAVARRPKDRGLSVHTCYGCFTWIAQSARIRLSSSTAKAKWKTSGRRSILF